MDDRQQYDEAKFTEAVLYVARRLVDDPSGGATKLNKTLFFAEFAHMREHGRSITGAEYQKLPCGPAPRRLLPVRSRLVASGAAELRDDVYLGLTMQRLVPLLPSTVDRLAPSELASLDQAVDSLRGQSGTSASDVSHREPGWQMVAEGETIPYEAAYLREPVVTDAVRRRIEALAAGLPH